MKGLKRILIAATLLVTLVGGAGQASADTGLLPVPTPVITADATVTPAGVFLSFGVSWE
jgi:hypothetical protein